jgi:APA family basic amino acid/polyamine antiporter
MLLLVSNTGAIAALAVTFARYAAALFHVGGAWVQPLAVGAIVLLSGINYIGIRPGSVTQNIFTLLKLLALAVLIGFGLTWGRGFDTVQPVIVYPSGNGAIGLIGIALIPVLFSYGGWQHANHIAGELVRPRRNLPRALLIGVGIVVIVYLLANWAYLHALGPERLAASLAPASDAMQSVLGDAGSALIGAGIVASTFGILNLYILAAPRVFQAMADDGLFFKRMARLHPRYQTPAGPIVLQAAWGIVLTLTGTYSQLLDFVVFGDWIFFALVVGTLFFYRQHSGRENGEDAQEGFRMIGFPWLPALFIAVAVFVVYSSVRSNPLNALVGLVLIGAGVPVFWFWKRQRI